MEIILNKVTVDVLLAGKVVLFEAEGKPVKMFIERSYFDEPKPDECLECYGDKQVDVPGMGMMSCVNCTGEFRPV